MLAPAVGSGVGGLGVGALVGGLDGDCDGVLELGIVDGAVEGLVVGSDVVGVPEGPWVSPAMAAAKADLTAASSRTWSVMLLD